MVGSIQPEWVCGPVPPVAEGRHGQAIEMISGIYAVHVLDQKRSPKNWYESFCKIWHRGGHPQDFNKTCRGAHPDDHDYYKSHYEPGGKALAHHVQALADTDAWRRRMEQNEYVTELMKKTAEIEKRRQSFRDLARHEQEQKDLCCKAERSMMKLVGMTTIHNTAPRARDMPQFNPCRIGTMKDVIHIGIDKDPSVFHPEYTNLYKLDRYLKDLDSVKRGLLMNLRTKPARVPYEELWNIVKPIVDPENAAAALEVQQIADFENRLDDLIAGWRAKESLQPLPLAEIDPDDLLLGSHQIEDGGLQDDYQKYGC